MSRSGYSDDCEGLNLWRGAVESAIRGKRGQSLLRDLAVALDAMPEKRLIANELKDASGEFCTLGVLGARRGVDVTQLDPEDRYQVADAFDIAPAMAAEIVYENDEVIDDVDRMHVVICGPMRTDWPHWERHERWVRVPIDEDIVAARRWQHMRQWVESNLVKEGS